MTANAENTAGGFGLTPKTARNLLDAGVDVMTSGNHIWDKKDILPHMDELPLLRPANYYGAPGRGWMMHGDVMVLNLQGRVFMPPIDCPFREADQRLAEAEAELGRPSRRPGRFPRRSHLREAGPRLVSGRPSQRRGWHPHPRRDR